MPDEEQFEVGFQLMNSAFGVDFGAYMRGMDGEPGEPGEPGLSVTGAEIDASGHLIVTLSDGTTIDAGNAKGAQGIPGEDGQDGQNGQDGHSPVVTATKSGGVTTILVDGTAIATVNDGVNGQNGTDGQDGTDGADGFSPEVTVTTIPGGHRITIVDAQGSHAFDVMDGQGGGGGDVVWGGITGTLSQQTDLQDALDGKVDKETGKGLFSGNYNDLSNIPIIRDGFSVTYGTTTFAEITAALAENKMPYCIYNDRFYSYTGISNAYHCFTAVVATTAYRLYIKNTWGSASFDIYSKASGGIPLTDLAISVQASIGKADTAVQNTMTADATGLAAGATPTVTYNAGQNKLTFGIPKGDKGDTGAPGADGEDGPPTLVYGGTAITETNVGASRTLFVSNFNRTPVVNEHFLYMNGSANMSDWRVTAVSGTTCTVSPTQKWNIKGEQGTPGTNGTNGTNGQDGYTPVRGVDYWTDADQTSIVNDVLAALPTWTGGDY